MTGSAGLVAVAEVVNRLGIVGALDEGIGPLKQRDRGRRCVIRQDGDQPA
ncbi:hypothetical protein FDG2_4141 [Candidatus Protofrankia californiensis]|uniref:Uncharacterized protein n=1 Tax=Candidatus Protofrankia californiensis TaxID=1839754 RepID=A0A1C3P3Y3_9ACTN|nr:hypothetical protein FDG2_4141 [Candidatus Protofrankia californiensis]